MSDIASVISNYKKIKNTIPDHVELIAVSKHQPIEKIETLAKIHKDFGENYVQELVEKAEQLPDLRWHFIGKIQSNKIRPLAKNATCIHTLCSKKHALKLDGELEVLGKSSFPVFISVNIGSEPQKDGLSVSEVKEFEQFCNERCRNLVIEGVMSIPPSPDSSLFCESMYQELLDLSQTIGNKKLSLGMSRDLDIAVANGSTHVRVGTAIFGDRTEKIKSV